MIFIVVMLATTFLMAALALGRSRRALDGAIVAQLRLNAANYPGAWMQSLELAYIFGGEVYPRLRRMVEAGIVEQMRRPSPPDGPRGGRDSYWYRWRGGAIVRKLKNFD
jgi:hypothetical protein